MERFEELYRQLFKNICEYSAKDRKNTKLTTHFPVVGKHYTIPDQSMKQEEQKPRFMIVGRCSNGWESQPHVAFEYNNEDRFIKEAMGYIANRATAAQWREDAKQPKENRGKPYNINRSAFWRTAKYIWTKLNEADSEKANDWFEYIIWTNLFPVAPVEGGNASTGLRDVQFQSAIELFNSAIWYFKPTHILIESGWDWFFNEKHECGFIEKVQKIIPDSNRFIEGVGYISDILSRVVVTVRPEGKSEYGDNGFNCAVIQAFKNGSHD